MTGTWEPGETMLGEASPLQTNIEVGAKKAGNARVKFGCFSLLELNITHNTEMHITITRDLSFA